MPRPLYIKFKPWGLYFLRIPCLNNFGQGRPVPTKPSPLGEMEGTMEELFVKKLPLAAEMTNFADV